MVRAMIMDGKGGDADDGDDDDDADCDAAATAEMVRTFLRSLDPIIDGVVIILKTERQTDRHARRQTDRQTDRQIESAKKIKFFFPKIFLRYLPHIFIFTAHLVSVCEEDRTSKFGKGSFGVSLTQNFDLE
jgi:hypothetical protein